MQARKYTVTIVLKEFIHKNISNRTMIREKENGLIFQKKKQEEKTLHTTINFVTQQVVR